MDRKELFRKSFEKNFTYIGGFMRNVARCGDWPAVYSPATGVRLTYDELNRNVNRLAWALQRNGVKKGDVVMYMLHNSVEFVYCYLAPQKLAAVNCPINYNLSAGEIALNIDDSMPDVFVYDESCEKTVELALGMCSFRPKTILSVAQNPDDNGPGSLEAFMCGCPETEPDPGCEFDMYDETTRLYTSGTTNRPKGVPLYSINEVLSAHDVIMHFPMSPGDKTMNTTPWFHRGGIHSGGPCPTLYIGGEVVIMREFNARATLQATQDYGLNFLIGVPATLSMLCRMQEQRECDLSSLKGIVTMGAPLDKENCIRFMKVLTPRIFNGYGTTETFWNTFLRPSDLPEHAGSCGRACTDDDVRVVKIYPDREAAPDDLVEKNGKELGEIIIGSWAKSSLQYFANEALTDKRYRDGFFYTGDLGTWDKDSFVTLEARKDDMIVSAGENIYPSQVESVIEEFPAVAEACVVGVPDRLREQIPVAYVVAKEGANLQVKDLVQFINENHMLATYKRPKLYKICQTLPHTATGKLQRALVRIQAIEDYANGLLHR